MWYVAEPWTLTFVDDGPYRSVVYEGEVDDLRLLSVVELHRFGRPQFILETRLTSRGDESIFILRNPSGATVWRRRPVKPDGELGPIELSRANATWSGGWRVGIRPARQEAGALYLGPRGGFRFFNHSW